MVKRIYCNFSKLFKKQNDELWQKKTIKVCFEQNYHSFVFNVITNPKLYFLSKVFFIFAHVNHLVVNLDILSLTNLFLLIITCKRENFGNFSIFQFSLINEYKCSHPLDRTSIPTTMQCYYFFCDFICV
jgi:hypothetical protein